MRKTRYTGTFIDFPNLGEVRILHDYSCMVSAEGFIVSFGPRLTQESASPEEEEIRLPEGSFLLPTFVDLHLHAPQFLYQGTGLHLPLMQWLEQYAFRAEERIDADPVLARRVYARLAARLLELGTGAVLLFGTISEESNLILAEEMQRAGVRAFVGKLSMDISARPSYVEATADASLAAARSFIAKMQNLVAPLPPHARLVEPVITPRFVPTCSDALLHGLGALAHETGVRVQSHLAEARDQVDYVLQSRGVPDIDIFDRAGLLTSRTVQAHCTYLDRTSLGRLATCGTAVAHCALSNAYFSGKPCPLREALSIGVPVGLGSDVAGGYTADPLAAMRATVMVSRLREGARYEATIMDKSKRRLSAESEDENLSVNWKEALYLATRGGALALDLPKGSGTFMVGAPFDAQLIHLYGNGMGVGPLDLFDVPDPNNPINEEMLEKWWCIGDAANRLAVWVQGERRSRLDSIPDL